MRLISSSILWAALLAIALYSLFLRVRYVEEDEYHSQDRVSRSSADAKQNGVYIGVAVIQPSEVEWKGRRLRFEDVWVEEVSRMRYQFLLFPKRVRIGKYRICFAVDDITPWLQGRSLERPPFFVAESKGSSLAEHWFKGSLVFSKDVETPKAPPLHISFINDWSSERKNDITITVE